LQQWEQLVREGGQRVGVDLREVATTDVANRINQTEVTQPLLVLSHYLHFHSANHHLTLSPQDYMIGHSLGEFSALVNAGSLSLLDGLSLVHQRGKLMTKHTLTPHSMLIVKFKSDKE
jgi:malonyl CoA-acyl carrier protein transacylase